MIALRLDGQHTNDLLEGLRGHVRRIQSQLEPLCREVRAFGPAHDYVGELSKRCTNWAGSATALSRA